MSVRATTSRSLSMLYDTGAQRSGAVERRRPSTTGTGQLTVRSTVGGARETVHGGRFVKVTGGFAMERLSRRHAMLEPPAIL